MEYVEGHDLRSRIAPHAFDDVAIRKALRELCTATDFLHQRGLCHRDIKTDNIRLRPNGDLVLLDLGVLRPLAGSETTDTPTHRHFVGTLRYAPPELLRRERSEDAEAWRAIDIYQIGTVLYELIQGARLFGHVPEDPYAEVVLAVLQERPSLVRSDVGDDLLRVTRNALEKEPEARLTSAAWVSVVAVANATPTLPTSPDEIARDLDRRLHEAATRYAPVADAMRRASAARQRGTAAFDSAIAILKEELDLRKRTWRGSEVVEERADHHTVVGVSIYEDLPLGFAGQLWIVSAVGHAQEPVGHVSVQGLALHTPAFFANADKSVLGLLHANDLGRSFEVVHAEAFEAAGFRQRISTWFNALVVKHLEATQALATEKLRQAQLRAEHAATRIGGSVIVTT